MADSRDDILNALRWTLRNLELAGVTRIPRLLPEAAPAAASVPSAPGAPGGAVSWADAARQLKDQLGGKVAASKAAKAAPKMPPAAAMAPASSGAKKTAPAAAKSDDGDPALVPSRPVEPKRKKALDDLAATVAKCTRCKELARTRTQTVFNDGPPNAELMFIGEAPGEDEDRQGVPFVGRAGQLLTKIITGGMRMRREDVYICNILKCRPPGNRNPQADEAANCREFLDAQIDLVAPKVICLLGGIATRFLLDDNTPVGRMRGKWHDYRGIPVRVTYHPAYLLRNYTPDARQKVWDDVLEVVRKLKALATEPGGPKDPPSDLF
jgi:DNA polymerase